MLLKKVPLNEEIARMRILAGVPIETTVIEEGFMTKVAAILGIASASLTGVFSQTGNLDKLKYSDDKKAALEKAMTDSNVVNKLHELGVEDNNIQRSIDYVKGKEITGYTEKTTSSEREVTTLVKAGWHLTAVESDTLVKTIIKEAPGTLVDTIYSNLDEDAMFASGRFNLSESDMSNIKNVLTSIEDSGSVLLNVVIVSSTDKQGLTQNLQNILSSLSYTPNNEGLSKARNDGVLNTLTSLGIDNSIINQEILFERGGPTIDQNSRYVKIGFVVVKYKKMPAGVEPIDVKTVKSAYELFKPLFKYGTVNIGKYKSNVCRTNIQTYKPKTSALKCMFKQEQSGNKFKKPSVKSIEKFINTK
jgi:outer membrane protein OmpA-like peptidoglycan-associated protein